MTPTFCGAAPVLVLVIIPAKAPVVAVALIRAVMVVVATLPPVGVSVNVELKVAPPSDDNSTPAGAVIVMGAVRLLPATV